MSASIHGSSVHSVRARVTVSAGGPWYPDARDAAANERGSHASHATARPIDGIAAGSRC